MVDDKGYICVVQNNETTDYLKLAYTLALSIKKSQSVVNKLSIVTDITDIPEKYKNAFDHIIPIENDRAMDDSWKLKNIVDLYEYTPYDETVMLDCDMLFLSDVSHWWDYLSMREIWFTTHAYNFKNELVPERTIYREEFVINELPSVYNAFFYFKKCETSKELFDTMKNVCDNWDYCVSKYLHKKRPKVFSTDIAFGLSLKLLGYGKTCTFDEISFPKFTHMKLHNMGWKLQSNYADSDWSTCTDTSYSEFNSMLSIKIGTLRQYGVFHYHAKHFITDGMIEILEN